MDLKKRFKLYKSGKMWCCAAVAFGVLAFGTINGQADDAAPVSNQVTSAQVGTTSTQAATTDGVLTTSSTSASTDSTQVASQTVAPVTQASAHTQAAYAASNTLGTTDTLDISAYQPNISVATYQQYHNQGINNVVVKLSEGTGWVNTYAQQQVSRASQAGMNVSAYHFVRFTTAQEAQSEAALFARMAKGIGLGYDTLMIADVEQVPQTQYAGIANNLNVFWKTLDSLGFTNHGVYTGLYYDYQYHVSSTVGKARTWVAAYGNFRSTVQNGGYGAWQYTDNWNGTNIDATIDFGMFSNYGGVKKTKAANLDGISIDGNNNLVVSGWYADNDSEGKNNRYVILLDQDNGNQEIARQKVAAVTRTDVANVYNDIYDAGDSGFTANFAINGQLATAIANGHHIVVLMRYTSSNDGNSDFTDNRFNGVVLNKNVASLDAMNLSNNGIHVAGWHAADQSVNRPYHYVILFDKTTNSEISRQRVNNTSRNDVAQVYGDVYQSGQSGFSTDFAMNDALRAALQRGDQLQVISRYTDDQAGNNNAIDYWFAPQAFNANQAYLDSFNIVNNQIQVSGWHAADLSTVDPNQWIILLDAQTGKEVARTKATTTQRADVADRYSSIANANNSGFTANFDIANNAALQAALMNGHSLQVVARYSDNAQNGEGNYVQNFFTPKNFTANVGYLDGIQRTSDGNLQVSGWHASNQAAGRPYHYVILYDASRGQEITRTKVANDVARPDVQKVYPNVYNSQNSGFNVTFQNSGALRQAISRGDRLQVIDRYSADEDGNTNYVDYWSNQYQL